LRRIILLAVTFWSLFCGAADAALGWPPLKPGINDFAGMFPQASFDDLEHRLHRFHTETSNTVAVLTLKDLEGQSIDSVAQRALKSLPLSDLERQRSVVLVIARKERVVTFAAGDTLRPLLPQPLAGEKLLANVALYWDGMRSDLGIHGAVHYLLLVLRGDVRVGSQTEQEKLQQTSLRGGEAGAIFALCLGPFLAFFIGLLWGIYATQYRVQRYPRLLMSAIFGGATAKIVATLMSVLGGYSDNLWYFIMALAIPLSIFGSLTEFWMAGDWRGIPRIKGPRRKPEDNMGI
jgi:uncharacterized membrane protein YgcG